MEFDRDRRLLGCHRIFLTKLFVGRERFVEGRALERPHDLGDTNVRLYTEKKRETAEIEGLSERSRAEASHLSEELQKVSDVRLYLRFLENGMYRLELLAASKTGTRRVHIERKAEGNCDTKIAKPKPESGGVFARFEMEPEPLARQSNQALRVGRYRAIAPA